jgi:hypothetical protein
MNEDADERAQRLGDLQGQLMAMLETGGLDGRLLSSAAEAMRTALISESWPEIARSAGQALEWLAKAILFREDPAELARPGTKRERSVAYLTGQGHPEVASLAHVMTQNGPESIRDAFEVLGMPKPPLEELDARILVARNAATHLDFVSGDDAARALFHSMAYCGTLLPYFGLTLKSWIEDDDLIEAAHAVAAHGPSMDGPHNPGVAHVRVAQARRKWLDLQARVPGEVLDHLSAHPEMPEDLPSADLLVPCPTGGHLAWVELETELSDEQDDIEDSQNYDLFYGYLQCRLCGLDLEHALLADLGMGAIVGVRVDNGSTYEDFL